MRTKELWNEMVLDKVSFLAIPFVVTATVVHSIRMFKS